MSHIRAASIASPDSTGVPPTYSTHAYPPTAESPDAAGGAHTSISASYEKACVRNGRPGRAGGAPSERTASDARSRLFAGAASAAPSWHGTGAAAIAPAPPQRWAALSVSSVSAGVS